VAVRVLLSCKWLCYSFYGAEYGMCYGLFADIRLCSFRAQFDPVVFACVASSRRILSALPLGYYTMASMLMFLKRGQSKKKPMENLSLCRLLFEVFTRARCREKSAHRSHGLAAWPQSTMEDRSNQQFLGGGGQYQASVWLLCILEW